MVKRDSLLASSQIRLYNRGVKFVITPRVSYFVSVWKEESFSLILQISDQMFLYVVFWIECNKFHFCANTFADIAKFMKKKGRWRRRDRGGNYSNIFAIISKYLRQPTQPYFTLSEDGRQQKEKFITHKVQSILYSRHIFVNLNMKLHLY